MEQGIYAVTVQVAIALSLLTAEVTKPPFNKLICTFSAEPELHLVTGASLVEQVCAECASAYGVHLMALQDIKPR